MIVKAREWVVHKGMRVTKDLLRITPKILYYVLPDVIIHHQISPFLPIEMPAAALNSSKSKLVFLSLKG